MLLDSNSKAIWTSPVRRWEDHDEKGKLALLYSWHHGDLSYKLDPLQKEIMNRIKSFFVKCTDSFSRLYVLDLARRLGKDWISFIYVLEEMAKTQDGIYIYATAFQSDLLNILAPLLAKLQIDCPPEYRLIPLKSVWQYRHPQANSVLKLCGLDVHPDSIRGSRCNGAVLTETAYIDHIEEAESSLLPQLMEDVKSWRIYNSTPSESIASKWSREIVPSAKVKGNCSCHRLDESPRFSREQIEAAYEEFGGRTSTKSKREYQCEHIGEIEAMVIPEWPSAKPNCLVDSYPRPQAAHCYLGMDPGMVDLTGIVAGFYDLRNDILVIERAEAERRLNTGDIATLIQKIETDLGWWSYRYFTLDGMSHSNPFSRVCDRELRLIADLHEKYGLYFERTAKHDLHAAINSLRVRIAQHKIRILPGANKLITHLDSAIWNKQRTQLMHVTPELGHFDLLMALVYLHRNIDLVSNPYNPYNTYPANFYNPNPQQPPTSGWNYQRDAMGNIIT